MYSKSSVKNVFLHCIFLESLHPVLRRLNLTSSSHQAVRGKSVIPTTVLLEPSKFSPMYTAAIYTALFFPSLPKNDLFERG